jgi:hypothetical protein
MPRKATSTTLSPTIPVDQAAECCFIFGGQTYHLGTCSVDVLRSLVRSALPKRQHAKRGPAFKSLQALLALLDKESDELTRWYVIEELIALKVRVEFAA